MISSSSSDKLLASVVSAGILEPKVESVVHPNLDILTTTSEAQKTVKCLEMTMDESSHSQNIPDHALNSLEERLPPLPQELLMSYVKDTSGAVKVLCCTSSW